MTTTESPAARLLRCWRSAAIDLVLDDDDFRIRVVPEGALSEADMRLGRRHAAAIRAILQEESQRAMVAAKIANLPAHRPQESPPIGGLLDAPPPAPVRVSQAAAATMLNVSTKSVKRATTVRKRGTPDLVAKVQRGEMPVSVAGDVARMPAAKQAAASPPARGVTTNRARRRLQQTVPDELAALDAATRDGDPEVAAAARSALARLMAAAGVQPCAPCF